MIAPDFHFDASAAAAAASAASPSDAQAAALAAAGALKRKKRQQLHHLLGELSDGSIRTAATKDRNSPALSSPRIPKVHNIPIDLRNEEEEDLAALAARVRPKKFKYRVPLKLKKGILDKSDPHNESAEVEAILAGLEDSSSGKDKVMMQTGAYLEMARAYNR